jgi:hypothetical protein
MLVWVRRLWTASGPFAIGRAGPPMMLYTSVVFDEIPQTTESRAEQAMLTSTVRIAVHVRTDIAIDRAARLSFLPILIPSGRLSWPAWGG